MAICGLSLFTWYCSYQVTFSVDTKMYCTVQVRYLRIIKLLKTVLQMTTVKDCKNNINSPLMCHCLVNEAKCVITLLPIFHFNRQIYTVPCADIISFPITRKSTTTIADFSPRQTIRQPSFHQSINPSNPPKMDQPPKLTPGKESTASSVQSRGRSQPISIFARKRDLAYLVFFCIHIPVLLRTFLFLVLLMLCVWKTKFSFVVCVQPRSYM